MLQTVFKWRARCALGLALLLAPAFAMAATDQANQPDQLGQLTAALAPQLKDIGIETSAADLAAGKPARAELTLQPGLLEQVQAEAGKLGLRRPARRVSVTARLSGQGYAITPNGDQTAALEVGKPVTFDWQVAPSAGTRGPLTADLKGSLDGGAAPQGFALAQLSVEVAPPAPAASAAPAKEPGFTLARFRALSKSALAKLRKLKLSDLGTIDLDALQIPGHRTVTIPGVGAVPSQQLVTGAILLVIVILLWAIARNAAARKRRAERRRRFRTFESTIFGQEPGHEL